MDDKVLPGMNKGPEEMAQEISLAADAGTGFSGYKLESYGYCFLRLNKFNLQPEQEGETKGDVLDVIKKSVCGCMIRIKTISPTSCWRNFLGAKSGRRAKGKRSWTVIHRFP